MRPFLVEEKHVHMPLEKLCHTLDPDIDVDKVVSMNIVRYPVCLSFYCQQSLIHGGLVVQRATDC